MSHVLYGYSDDFICNIDPAVRIFLSSTFTDTGNERDCILIKVLPKLRNIFRSKFNVDLRILDFRWGIRDEMTNDHLTEDICCKEIEKCKSESISTYFVTLYDQKYGYCPCPRLIPLSEFDSILNCLCADNISIIREFYVLDENCIPPCYTLKAVSAIAVNYWAIGEEGESSRQKYWDSYKFLQSALREGVMKAKEIPEARKMQYFQSITEKEIRTALDGCQDTENESKVLWFRRNLSGVNETFKDRKLYGSFVEVIEEISDDALFKRDPESFGKLQIVHDYLTNNKKVKCLDIAQEIFVEDLQSDSMICKEKYLEEFCLSFYDNLLLESEKSYLKREKLVADIKYDDLMIKVLKEANLHLILKNSSNLPIIPDFCQSIINIRPTNLYSEGPYPSAVPVPSSTISRISMSHLESMSPEDQVKLTVLTGDSGCGLSTICAAIAENFVPQYRDDKTNILIFRVCGKTPDSYDIVSLIRSLTLQILLIFGKCGKHIQHSNEYDLLLREWLSALDIFFLSKTENIIQKAVVIDGIEKLKVDEYLLSGDWIPKSTQSPGLGSFIITMANTSKLDRLKSKLEKFSVLVPNMSSTEIICALQFQLRYRFNRRLSPSQLEKLTEKLSTKVKRPVSFAYYLSLITSQWQSDFDCTESLSKLDPSDIPSIEPLARGIFEELTRTHGLLAKTAFRCLSCSRFGLTDDEVCELLSDHEEVLRDVQQYHKIPHNKIPPLLWIRLRQSMPFILSLVPYCGGALSSWSNGDFSVVARSIFLQDLLARLSTHRHLIHLFESLETLKWVGARKRYLEELPWQLLQCIEICEQVEVSCEELLKLQKFLERPDNFEDLLQSYPDDLRMYWGLITRRSGDMKSTMMSLGNSLDSNSDGLLYLATNYLEQTDYSSCKAILTKIVGSTSVDPIKVIKAHRLYALLEMRCMNFTASLYQLDSAEKLISLLPLEEQEQKEVVEAFCDCKLHRVHLYDVTKQPADTLLNELLSNKRFNMNPLKKSRLLMRLAHIRMHQLKVQDKIASMDTEVMNVYEEALELARQYHDFNLVVDIESKKLLARSICGLTASVADYDKLINLCDETKNFYFKLWAMHDKALLTSKSADDSASTLHQKNEHTQGFIDTIRCALIHGESASSRVIESARTIMADLVIGYFENVPSLNRFSENSVRIGVIQSPKSGKKPSWHILESIPATRNGCPSVDFTENQEFLHNLMNAATLNSTDTYSKFVKSRDSDDDAKLRSVLELVMPVHGCTIGVLMKILKSGELLSQHQSSFIRNTESEISKTISAIAKSDSCANFLRDRWPQDFEKFYNITINKSELQQQYQQEKQISIAFEATLLAIVGKLRFIRHPDAGEYEISRITHALTISRIFLGETLFENNLNELVEKIKNEEGFRDLTFDYGYAFYVQENKSQGSLFLNSGQSDTIYGILGPNAHFGGVSIIFNHMLLSHPATRLMSPGEMTLQSGRYKVTHPFYDAEIDEKYEITQRYIPEVEDSNTDPSSLPKNSHLELLSKFTLNASCRDWASVAARVIGASGRLKIEKLKNPSNSVDVIDEVSIQDVIDLYMTHDCLLQKELNIEAHLPSVIPLELINHILISVDKCSPAMLKTIKAQLADLNLISRTRFFANDEQRAKWMQVYQSCDPSILSRVDSMRPMESTLSSLRYAVSDLSKPTFETPVNDADIFGPEMKMFWTYIKDGSTFYDTVTGLNISDNGRGCTTSVTTYNRITQTTYKYHHIESVSRESAFHSSQTWAIKFREELLTWSTLKSECQLSIPEVDLLSLAPQWPDFVSKYVANTESDSIFCKDDKGESFNREESSTFSKYEYI